MYLTLPNCTFKNGPKSSFYSTYILSQKRRQGLGRVKNDIVPMRKKKKKGSRRKKPTSKKEEKCDREEQRKHGRDGKLWFSSGLRGNSSWSATFVSRYI